MFVKVDYGQVEILVKYLLSVGFQMVLLPILNPLVGEKVILCSALLASIAYVSYLCILLLLPCFLKAN